jgi:hypothetical protein
VPRTDSLLIGSTVRKTRTKDFLARLTLARKLISKPGKEICLAPASPRIGKKIEANVYRDIENRFNIESILSV